jgi:multidrug efflux pump subunit AcrA (membrane-fusion protein)
MQQDSLQYARYRKLHEQQAVAQSSYEKIYLQYQASLKEYASLRQQWQQQRLAGDIQLQQAENQWAVAAAQSGVGQLKSFANGVVYDVYKKEGDLIAPGQPIALIGAGPMIARLLVDEDDLDKVFTGQKVLLTLDAFPDKVFHARISRIYPYLNKVEQSFRVDAVLETPLPVSIYGLNLEANIVVSEGRQVLAIPKSALLRGDSVLVKEGQETRKVKIVKGIEDDNWVEVVSGVLSSATIINEL